MKRTAIIEVREDTKTVLEEARKRVIDAWNTGTYQGEVFSFSSAGQLFSVLTPKRWRLIETLQSIGPSSLRGLARTLGRDVKRVHGDVDVLLEWGFVERDEAGKLVVPFDVIRADFELRPSAA